MPRRVFTAFKKTASTLALASLRRTDSSISQQIAVKLACVFQKLVELRFTPNKSSLVRIRSWSANFDTQIHTSSKTIELLFVVTKKDFEVLPLAIKYAIRNLDNFNLAKISLVTPSLDLKELPTAIYELSEKIQVYRDEEFINAETIAALRSNFSARAGWYIQQILKLVLDPYSY